MALVELRGVCKSFRKGDETITPLDEVDLDIEAGRRKIAAQQQLQQLLREPRIAQLHRRDVDRQRQARVPAFRITQSAGDK